MGMCMCAWGGGGRCAFVGMCMCAWGSVGAYLWVCPSACMRWYIKWPEVLEPPRGDVTDDSEPPNMGAGN